MTLTAKPDYIEPTLLGVSVMVVAMKHPNSRALFTRRWLNKLISGDGIINSLSSFGQPRMEFKILLAVVRSLSSKYSAVLFSLIGMLCSPFSVVCSRTFPVSGDPFLASSRMLSSIFTLVFLNLLCVLGLPFPVISTAMFGVFPLPLLLVFTHFKRILEEQPIVYGGFQCCR